jgi:hypothetical protein
MRGVRIIVVGCEKRAKMDSVDYFLKERFRKFSDGYNISSRNQQMPSVFKADNFSVSYADSV